jgi:hypothetical protein
VREKVNESEILKAAVGVSMTAAVAAVASHVRVRERVARLEERVTAIGEKIDETLGGVSRLEQNATKQALQTDRVAIKVDAIMDTIQARQTRGDR